MLTWQDFELLVDLVFSTSGWRRTSIVGKTQKTLDLELEPLTTSEKAFVQIKSYADAHSFSDYAKRFRETCAYERMFFYLAQRTVIRKYQNRRHHVNRSRQVSWTHSGQWFIKMAS